MRTIALIGLILLAGCTMPVRQDVLCNPAYYTVRGMSLAPRVNPGDMVIVESNKSCYNITRDDLVIYSYAGNDAPLIKAVKGVPGDHWRLDGCRIIINNKTLKNDNDQPYCVNTKMLSLYANDYPTLEEGTYLLLGEKPGGTLDASTFGLASEKDIIGKVIEVKP